MTNDNDNNDNEMLIERMADILTKTAIALHGGYAPPDCLHSWHDLPELVEKLRKERDEARRSICEDLAQLDGAENGLSCPAKIAQERGWEYLYPNDPFYTEDAP